MGLSSNMMAAKMKAAAEKLNYECVITAYSFGNMKEAVEDTDCLLIGPQIQYQLSKIQSCYPHIPVKAVRATDYGTMDGEAVLNMAREIMHDR